MGLEFLLQGSEFLIFAYGGLLQELTVFELMFMKLVLKSIGVVL